VEAKARPAQGFMGYVSCLPRRTALDVMPSGILSAFNPLTLSNSSRQMEHCLLCLQLPRRTKPPNRHLRLRLAVGHRTRMGWVRIILQGKIARCCPQTSAMCRVSSMPSSYRFSSRLLRHLLGCASPRTQRQMMMISSPSVAPV
jgi:hypothetical protein